MADVTLKVEERELKTKSHLKRLRKEGKIPAIFYHHDEKPIPIQIDERDFHHLVHVKANVFDLDFGDGHKRSCIIRDIQLDPVTGKVLHVDLMGIKLTEKLVVTIPLRLVGTPKGVKEGGILEQILREVAVEGLPADLPEAVEIDVSDLEIGDTLHVKDVSFDKFTLMEDPDQALVTVAPPEVEEVEAAPPEEEEEVEPEVIKERAKKEEEEKEKE